MTSIQQLFQLSVSIAFNFLGTENMKNGDYMAAFSYFQKAADRGYSKAQYNVGLCHEHGRGTPRDPSKAAFYYHWLPARATTWLSTAMQGACYKTQAPRGTLSGRGQCPC